MQLSGDLGPAGKPSADGDTEASRKHTEARPTKPCASDVRPPGPVEDPGKLEVCPGDVVDFFLVSFCVRNAVRIFLRPTLTMLVDRISPVDV